MSATLIGVMRFHWRCARIFGPNRESARAGGSSATPPEQASQATEKTQRRSRARKKGRGRAWREDGWGPGPQRRRETWKGGAEKMQQCRFLVGLWPQRKIKIRGSLCMHQFNILTCPNILDRKPSNTLIATSSPPTFSTSVAGAAEAIHTRQLLSTLNQGLRAEGPSNTEYRYRRPWGVKGPRRIPGNEGEAIRMGERRSAPRMLQSSGRRKNHVHILPRRAWQYSSRKPISYDALHTRWQEDGNPTRMPRLRANRERRSKSVRGFEEPLQLHRPRRKEEIQYRRKGEPRHGGRNPRSRPCAADAAYDSSSDSGSLGQEGCIDTNARSFWKFGQVKLKFWESLEGP
ncbi:hypothetical protein FB451DRAFT_1510204 [Mycena latifolia]|nr:hypothetical protein FB451DRAFT_1510204 [Mycena latifolia]